MPFVGGIYQPDQRSPLERLYGFRQKEDELRKLREQQAIEAQRKQIMAEGYTPAQEARIEYGAAVDAPAFDGEMARMSGPFATQQIEAKPAAFDRDGVINRLYGINDIEGADKLVNAGYKQSLSGGGIEKFGTGGDLIRGEDGILYKQLYGNRGGTKRIPVDGEKLGAQQVIKAGGRTFIKDPYTNETIEVIESTMTPGERADNDVELQSDLSEAKSRGKERGEAAGKAEAGLDTAIATYDKTIGIINELVNHPGRKAATGFSSVVNIVPGTSAYDYKQKLQQLSGQNFLTEIQRMKGQGALSDSEGRRLEAAAAALDAGREEEGFLGELIKLRDEINFYKQRALRKAQKGGAADKPSNRMNSLPSPAQHNGRTIRDTATGATYRSDGKQWLRVK